MFGRKREVSLTKKKNSIKSSSFLSYVAIKNVVICFIRKFDCNNLKNSYLFCFVAPQGFEP